VSERKPTSIRRHIFVCFPGACLCLSVHVCVERREQRGFFLQSMSIIEEIGLLNTITAMRQYRRGSSSCLEGCGTRSRGFFFFGGSRVLGVGEWTNCEEWRILWVCVTRV
jgi:hypothetical protein